MGGHIEDFYDDYPLFVDKDNIEQYSNIPFGNVFKDKKTFEAWLSVHKKTFDGFEQFLQMNKTNK